MNNFNTGYLTQNTMQPNTLNNNQLYKQSSDINNQNTGNYTVQNTQEKKPAINKINIAAISTAALAIITAGVCLQKSGKAKKALSSLQQTTTSLQDTLTKTQDELAKNQTELQKAQNIINQIQQKQQGLAENLLFPNGINGIEFKQSNIGDCYLLSSLYALSKKPMGEDIIKKMVTMTDDGNFIVKFQNYKPIKVTAAELKGQGNRRSVNADIGVQAIERAYGKYRKAMQAQQQRSAMMGHSLMVIDGGLCDNVLKFMNNNFNTVTYGSSIYGSFKTQKENIARVLDDLSNNFDKKVVCASTPTAQYAKIQKNRNGKQYGWMDDAGKFPCQHAYAVTGIDSKNKMVTIANPHDTEKPLTISYDVFENIFGRLYTAS